MLVAEQTNDICSLYILCPYLSLFLRVELISVKIQILPFHMHTKSFWPSATIAHDTPVVGKPPRRTQRHKQFYFSLVLLNCFVETETPAREKRERTY